MKTFDDLIDPGGVANVGEAPTLAARSVPLRGARVVLLDNGKVNGAQLLTAVGDLLAAEHGAVITGTVTKEWAGQPIVDEMQISIARDADIVISAIGDCGSCSAATVADGILLERRGVPTACILTTPFAVTGRAIARAHGFAGYRFVEAPHPVASLDSDGLRDRARSILADVVATVGVPA